jgi:hypothetical protein
MFILLSLLVEHCCAEQDPKMTADPAGEDGVVTKQSQEFLLVWLKDRELPGNARRRGLC